MRLVLTAVVTVCALATFARDGPAQTLAEEPDRIYAVSIDPADYLATQTDAGALATALTAKLAANGVNRIYVNAYNVEYGANYRTGYRYNEENEYGRQDLLGKLVAAAHARGIEVVAAFYDHQHRGAWEAQPGWREKTASGGDYNPPSTDVQFYLSPGNPDAATWWRGFLRDVLRAYPNLDGIEFREPIINWWGTEADYNPAVTRAFRAAHPDAPLGGETWRRFRQDVLTEFLKTEVALVHDTGRFAEVTTVADTSSSGELIPVESTAREVGFDLDGLLTGPVRPDAVKVELIWQQWASLYGRVAFTPGWTRTAARAFLEQVDGHAPVIVHVELTDFGRSTLSVEEFYRTLVAADIPRVQGVDFYSAALADAKDAWPAVRAVYGQRATDEAPSEILRDRRVLVLYDESPDAEGGTLAQIKRSELLNLLGHFAVKWEAAPAGSYRRGDLDGYDVVVYQGSVYGNAPAAFLSDVSVYDGTVVWIGQNLFQLANGGTRLPFVQSSQRAVETYRRIRYGNAVLPAGGEVIPTDPGPGAVVVASLLAEGESTPFVLRSGRFWYVAGSPFSFVSIPSGLNGRYLVFADLLHDMLGEPHRARPRQAFVRIEDIDPLVDTDALRATVGALAALDVPFLLAATPFHVDPARDLSVSLSERPAVVRALRDAVAQGGAIVLHGSTHQYTGKTGIDAEFWDLVNVGGVPEDSEEYVRARVDRGLRELWRNDLHPLAWETPHYLATPFDYAVFGDYFSTFVEQRTYGVWRGSAYTQPLPYVVEADVYGGRLLPENLGYVPAGRSDADALVENAERLQVVRDATAGGFVHVGTDPTIVADLIERIQELGYGFLDLFSLENVVEAPRRIDLTGGGTASLPVPSGWFLQERTLDRAGEVVQSSLERFPSYARPERSFAAAPVGGLLSLRLLTPDQGEALQEAAGTDAGPPSAGAGGETGTTLVYILLAAALVGVVLLLVAFALVRMGRIRVHR